MQIVGVSSPGFRYPGATDVWAAMRPTSHAPNRSDHPYQAVAKLKAGVDVARAQTQMRIIGDRLARQYPENRLKSATVTPLQERLTGSLQATLWVLMSAVGVVWLIGCANIANLLLARAAGRTREIALRAALGAGRGRVVRQLLTESCVLAGVAGVAGLLLAWTLVQALAALAPVNLPRLDEVRMDTPVLLFAVGLSLVSTVIFGLVPAVHASRLDLAGALKQGGSTASAAKAGTRLRSALVVAEVALSVVLLAAAGLLLRSLQTLQHVDLGFTKERVLVADTVYAVRDGSSSDLWIRSRFYADVLERLRAVPGVSAASGVAFLGMGREPRAPRDFFIQGRPEGRAGERPQAELHAVTADYFETLEIPVRAGRDFDRTDTPDRPGVAIINDAMARTAFPGEAAVGQRIRQNSRAPWLEIVGVVADTRWHDPSQPSRPVVYAASTQGTGNSLAILARTSLDDQSLAGTLRTIMREANPTVPVKFATLEALFDSTLAYPRFRTQVIGLFASVAALLATVGIFSVLAYLVGQRTRELAVRRALGASAANVVGLIMRPGLRLVALGLVLGLAGALAVSRLLTGLLYEVSPWDASSYLGTIAVLGGAAMLATLVPAVRAATISPLIALQQD
jgi:predicted permease